MSEIKDPIQDATARVEHLIISTIKTDFTNAKYQEDAESRLRQLAAALYHFEDDQKRWLGAAIRWRDSDD